MIRMRRSLFVGALALCLGSVAAQAQLAVVASLPASACVPADETTRFNRHRTDIAAVQHATVNVDPVVLNCALTRFDDGIADYRLRLIYQDSTGKTPAALVRAQLYRLPINVDPPIGSPTVTPILVTTANSNASAVAVANVMQSGAFRHDFDFNDSIYWIRLELDRSAATDIVVVHAVYLVGAFAPPAP